MEWYVYSVASMFFFAGMVLCIRHLGNKGYNAKQILTFLFFFALLEFLGFGWSSVSTMWRSEHLGTFLMFIIPGALFGTLGNLTDYSAVIKAPNPGYPAAVKVGSVILVTFLSVLFLGSSLSFFKLLGSLIVIAGIALLVVDKSATRAVQKTDGSSWSTLALIAAASYAILTLSIKASYGLGFSSLQINIFIFAFWLVAFVIMGWKHLGKWLQDVKSSRTFLFYVFLAGTLSFLANYFTVLGVGLSPNPGYNEAIKYSQTLLVTLVSVYLFGVPLTKQKLLGVVTVLVGASMVALL